MRQTSPTPIRRVVARRMRIALSACLCLPVLLEAATRDGERSPCETLAQFTRAVALCDEFTLRRVALPHPALAALASRQQVEAEQYSIVAIGLAGVTYRELRPGDRFATGTGQTVEVGRDSLREDARLVSRMFPGRGEEPPFVLRRYRGAWRVDAAPLIDAVLGPGAGQAAARRSSLPAIIARGELVVRKDAFPADLDRGTFATAAPGFSGGDDATASLVPPARAPAAFLGQPAVRVEATFADGYLNRLDWYLAAKGSGGTSAPEEVRRKLPDIDKRIATLMGRDGRFDKVARVDGRRGTRLKTKRWSGPEGDLLLEFATENGDGDRDETVFVRVAFEAPGGDSPDGEECPPAVAAVLAALGTDITPDDRRFWDQTPPAFLGELSARFGVHWTTEVDRDGAKRCRSSYIHTPTGQAGAEPGRLLLRNTPLSASGVALFGHPIAAMVAEFRNDRLAEFRFDFWNKGDGDEANPHAENSRIDEDDGNDAIRDLLSRFRKAGADPAREAAPAGSRVSRRRETRYSLAAGPTRVSLIPMRDEYYSMVLEPTEPPESEGTDDTPISGRRLRDEVGTRVKTVGNEPSTRPRFPAVEGDRYLEVPMIDQGPKGYCAPATVARIAQYYGRDATMNEMAAMMGTIGADGTDADDVRNGVRRVARSLRLSVREEDVISRRRAENERSLVRWIEESICRHIDAGNPVIWMVPEHVRLITGYNPVTGEILYSDSWGKVGYDRISYLEAAQISEALYVIR